MTNHKNTDLVIAGGGLAGLSLAYCLANLGFQKQVIILEKRLEYKRDRTWSFWWPKSQLCEFESCFEKSWQKWTVSSQEKEVTISNSNFRYVSLDSQKLYQFLLDKISTKKNFELYLDQDIEKIEWKNDACQTWSNDLCISSNLVVDARNQKFAKMLEKTSLYQQFHGWKVQTKQETFDPDKAVLMDFVDSNDSLRFVYLLPTDKNTALIEPTIFSANQLPEETVLAFAQNELEKRLGKTQFDILYEEKGCLPMSTKIDIKATKSIKHKRIIYFSASAGAARPATGYAFLSIQRQSKLLAENIFDFFKSDCFKNVPELKYYDDQTIFLDDIMLRYINQDFVRARSTFLSMFKNVPPDSLIRFLSGQYSSLDWFLLTNNMPNKADLIALSLKAII